MTSLSFGQTFYSENMGIPTGNTGISAYASGTAPATFQNSAPIVYTGTSDVRTSSASSGYANVSGGGNVFINAVDEFFQIDGINSSAYNSADIHLTFGVNTPSSVTNVLTVQVSTNGTDWTPITYTPTATGWTLATISGGVIPSSNTLSIRFSSSTTLQYRIDDIKLTSISASCSLSLGTATTACDASTLALDTYTLTIPFTGGGNATYTITPSLGTVGGDNPSTVASGNITISGITEGTAYSVTITGGTCNFNINGNSPECKPVNTLPFSESFPYSVGGSLNAEQKWMAANSGDNISINSGSLNYPGFTSTGNSATFSGAGAESYTLFTSTTSGTIYTSFIINVTDMANITADPSFTYFAGLTDGTSGGYNARLFLNRVGTQYQLGFDTASTTTNYDATLRNVGDVVFVVMGYDFGTNTLNAWFNPNLSTFSAATPATLTVTPTTALTAIGGFTIRQDDNARTPTIVFDELRIAETTTALLSVNQNSISGLKLYPNPVSNGTLFIETAANAEKTIAFYDVLGKNVLNASTTENAVNVSSLRAGIYVVKITEEGKTATRKLVIK